VIDEVEALVAGIEWRRSGKNEFNPTGPKSISFKVIRQEF